MRCGQGGEIWRHGDGLSSGEARDTQKGGVVKGRTGGY